MVARDESEKPVLGLDPKMIRWQFAFSQSDVKPASDGLRMSPLRNLRELAHLFFRR